MHFEHERCTWSQRADRGARERLGLALVHECLSRLPVAHFGLERVDLLRLDVRRIRDDEVERALGKPCLLYTSPSPRD